MGQPRYQRDGDSRTSGPGFGLTLHENSLHLPLNWKRPRLVFVNSMSDLFHAQVPLDFIRQVFDVIEMTPQHTYQILTKRARRLRRLAACLRFPQNVWIGVSIEDESTLHRMDELKRVPASVRFVSCEPLLGPIGSMNLEGIHWVIAGGESGPDARPVEANWIRSIRNQCQNYSVPFFFKQWGGRTPKAGGRLLDGCHWSEMPDVSIAVSPGS